MVNEGLDFEVKEKRDAGITILQLDDGTIFYWRYTSPQRLYTKRGGEVFEAELPEVVINCDQVYGNTIYFSTKLRIFKTVTTPSGGIKVSYLRNFLKGETDTTGGILTRERDGKKYAYGMWDDPEKDGAVIDDTVEELTSSMNLRDIHRGLSIYLKRSEVDLPTVRKFKPNAVVIEIPAPISADNRQSSPFFYFTCQKSFFALDTQSLKLLPPLKLNNVIKASLAGVHNGIVTLSAEIGYASYSVLTAQLPKEYYESTSLLSGLHAFKISTTPSGNHAKISTAPSIGNDGFDDLTDQCCCSICSEIFDSAKFIPRVLDCGHTFCEVCIYNEKMCVNNMIRCPNCSKVSDLQGRVLPINYTVIGMAEQLMKSRADPKETCKACKMNYSTSAVRLCIKKDCDMFNQVICLSCVVDGGHGGHVVKYDVKMEKIRNDLRTEVSNICSQVEEKKKQVLEKAKQLVKTVEKKLSEANIPSNVIGQLDTIASEQEANEYRDIVRDLGKTLMEEAEAFDLKLRKAAASF